MSELFVLFVSKDIGFIRPRLFAGNGMVASTYKQNIISSSTSKYRTICHFQLLCNMLDGELSALLPKPQQGHGACTDILLCTDDCVSEWSWIYHLWWRNLDKRAFRDPPYIKKMVRLGPGALTKNKITCPLNRCIFHQVCVAFKVDHSFLNITSLFWKVERNIMLWSLTSNPWRHTATGLIGLWSHITLFSMYWYNTLKARSQSENFNAYTFLSVYCIVHIVLISSQQLLCPY